jgi:sulfur-oxidizing protein SoxX
MKALYGVVLATLGLVLTGCDSSLKSTSRFRLPQGSAENGRAAFVALKCTDCHSLAGVDLPKPTATPDKVVMLGGEVARLRTIGDLLTSIVHPDFAISDKLPRPKGPMPANSPMRVMNDQMTVTQLIDLVTFLQPYYKQLPPPIDMHYSL